MTMQDPIADLLTRIRNAQRASHESVEMPCSKIKAAICEVLKEEGYIKDYRTIQDKDRVVIKIFLKYADKGERVIKKIERVSRPSRRIYVGKDEVPQVMNGLGTAIISTSKGVMTDKQARREGVGGEVLCTVW